MEKLTGYIFDISSVESSDYRYLLFYKLMYFIGNAVKVNTKQGCKLKLM